MTEAAPGLSVRGLSKIFGPAAAAQLEAVRQGLSKAELQARNGHVLALHDIDIDMPGAAVTVVMGLSGSGKSTLLRLLNRLIEPTAGQVLAGTLDVTALGPHGLREFRRRHTAMVFQRFALFPHHNVLRNVAYALELRGVPAAERDAAARRWIERVGLAGFERSWPAELSGGMQQRVGLARALAAEAPILLLDEAFSALDPLIRADMQMLVLGLQRELKKTMVFITHDLDEALRLGDHVVILRDGQVLQQGSPAHIVLQPADEHVQRFVAGVDRARVLRCAALAVPGLPVQGPRLDSQATLAEAARAMQSEGATAANVHAADGAALGTLTLAAVLAQIVA
ncbi:MAG: ATP-binding cassette domain-containing protein [Rubrivivax sp.]